MDSKHLEVDQVKLTIVNCGHHASRAETIARLTFDCVRKLMERELQHLGGDLTIARLEAPPINVSMDTMDDEAVAQASAEAVYRALLAAV